MEFTKFFNEVFESWVILLPIAVFAFVTLFRKLCAIWWPGFESNNIYKTLLDTIPYVIGIGLAFLIKGVGSLKGMTWGYLVVIGFVSGFLNVVVWRVVKSWIKRKLGMSDEDIAAAVERKSKLPNGAKKQEKK